MGGDADGSDNGRENRRRRPDRFDGPAGRRFSYGHPCGCVGHRRRGLRLCPAPRVSFGTGKVGDLGGFASALILALVSLGIGIESIMRLLQPTDEQVAAQIRELMEQPGDATITDLHVWQVGPGVHAAIVSVVGRSTANADSIRERLKPVHEVSHLTVEFRSLGAA